MTDRELHDAVIALYPKFNEKRIWFRNAVVSPLTPRELRYLPEERRVDRDMTVCALVNKAATTKAAIVHLCDAGLTDDAFCLCRVLMECSVYVTWILHDDWIRRLDTYILSLAPNQQHLAEVVQQHYNDASMQAVAAEILADPTLTAVAEEVFNDQYLKWAWCRDSENPGKLKPTSLNQMLIELDDQHVVDKKHVAYAAMYADMSTWVHSFALSANAFASDLVGKRVYNIGERRRRGHEKVAMVGSNAWMLILLSALNEFVNAGLGDEIDNLGDEFKRMNAPAVS